MRPNLGSHRQYGRWSGRLPGFRSSLFAHGKCGLLFLAWGIAGLLGGRLAGFVVDTYGSYELAFFGAATLSLLSLGTLLLTKAPQSPETASV